MNNCQVTPYRSLQLRIERVLKAFNFKQSLNGITSSQEDKLRGLRLLCHAEFEDHFENLAIFLVDNAFSEWQRQKIANYNLASLFVDSDKIHDGSNTQTKVNKIISDYKKIVQKNNGIKQEDILKLFKPLGYCVSDFDQTFLATLSSFGTLRGETAHTSALRAQQQLDKQTEIDRIKYILAELNGFETAIHSKIR